MIPWDSEEGTGGPRGPGSVQSPAVESRREGAQKATMPSPQNTDPGTAVLVFGKHS